MDSQEHIIEPTPESEGASPVESAQSGESGLSGKTHEMTDADSASALETLAAKFTEAATKAAEDAVRRILEERNRLKTLMDDFFDDPVNASIKPFRAEMEHLTFERGMSPGDAIDLINAMRRKFEAASREKSEASQRMRRLAALEAPEGTPSRDGANRAFDHVLKKAKTLEEMFAGLRKLGRV
jgi:hypothetical protein